MSEGLEEEFTQAATSVSSGAVGDLSQNEQLSLYGLYSVVRKGPAPEQSPSALLDPRGYAKWIAWREHSHMNREDAMLKYTELVRSLASVDRKSTSKKSEDGLGNKASMGFDLSYDEETTPSQSPDLCYWAATGDVAAVLNCLEKKISPNYRDEDNLTPLMRAADRNETHIVDLLVSAGADLDAVDDDGQSALHYAVYCEHVEMAALLASFGASLELRDGEGMTPAHAASPAINAAFEAVKKGTWKRTSTRYKRETCRIQLIPTLPSLQTISCGIFAAAVSGLFVAIVARYLRNS